MPRRNRKNKSEPLEEFSFTRSGPVRTQKMGRSWFVREISGQNATKVYVCPGCPAPIAIGQKHVVAWAADEMFGDERALSDRRHWHAHCWRLA